MAKQTGAIIIEGTIDDITFYKMDGKGYVRSKSRLRGERVKRDPRFRRTMQSANRFGKGNQLASTVYRSLPREQQVYALFKELKRIAILAIKEGNSESEVLMLLQEQVAAESRISGCPIPVVIAMKSPQPAARKAGIEYSCLGVSCEGRLVYGGHGYTPQALYGTNEPQILEVGVHPGKGP